MSNWHKKNIIQQNSVLYTFKKITFFLKQFVTNSENKILSELWSYQFLSYCDTYQNATI